MIDTRLDTRLASELAVVRDGMGWNPTVWEKLPTRLMCVICELNELEDAMHSGRVDDVTEELADVAIYLVLILHDLFAWPEGGVLGIHRTPVTSYRLPETLCGPTRSAVVGVMESWRRDRARSVVKYDLERALGLLCGLSNTIGCDLSAAIRAKTEVLRQRSPRNGGKHPDT